MIGVFSDNLLSASAAIRPDFGLRHGGCEVTQVAERSGRQVGDAPFGG
jgi:hypothetical protein